MIMLLAIWSITFAGGDDNALADSLAKSFSKPVVILADGRKPWPSVKESADSEAGLLAKLRQRFSIGGEQGIGAAPLGWPTGFAFKQAHNVYALNKVIYPQVVEETMSERISVQTEGKQVFQLHQIKLRGPKLKWHWFYNSVFLCSSARDSRTKDFLLGIAQAVGAKLTRSGDSHFLAFDPAVFKSRSLAAAQDPARTKLVGLDIEVWFRAQILKDMSDADISKAFETAGTRTRRVATPGTPLYRACINRIEWRYGSDRKVMETIRENTGENPIVQAVIDAGGAVSVSIRNRNGKWGILL